MTAPVRVQAPVLGDIGDFVEVCDQQAWFFSEGWIDLHTAVDNLQRLAELWDLIDEHGQDAVQAIMADAFAPAPELPSDYAAQMLMRWELDDPRDRWKWTGELPPPPEKLPEPRPRPVPQSTIDAFNYVIGLGDPDYLAKWLRNHSDVARALVEEVA